MALKTVQFISDICLPCACKGTVNVIICTIFSNATVPGILIASSKNKDCESTYEIQYNSDDLPEGVTALATSDITNVACKGCITTWVEEQLADLAVEAVSEENHEDHIDFTTDGEDGDVTISVTNPSATKALKGFVTYNWNLIIEGSALYGVGISSTITADGVTVSGTDRTLYESHSNPGGIYFITIGTSCDLEVTIDPGATVEYKLHLVASVADLPDQFTVSRPQISFFGVTVAA